MTEEALDQEQLDLAARYVANSSYLVALVGAGISVESGIRPFRGPGGIWTERGEPPMDGYQRFIADPKAWYEQQQARRREQRGSDESWERAKPNPAHYALTDLERMGLLRCIVTQNIDNLHQEAGSQHVAEIHGNRYKMRCISCGTRWPREEFEATVREIPPRCPHCGGLVKGDTVMFGEPIPPDVLARCRDESLQADCVLVVGTSAVVYPAAELPLMAKRRNASLIEVNPRDTALTPVCDVVLRGPAGEVLPQLVRKVEALLAEKR